MKTIKEKSFSVEYVIPNKKEQKEIDRIIEETSKEKLDANEVKKLKKYKKPKWKKLPFIVSPKYWTEKN